MEDSMDLRPTPNIGLLLPHFGDQASPDRLIQQARRIEDFGFDSVWVRDHLVYRPHEYENQDPTFVDPFVVLSAIAAVTTRIILGTAALIPHRNPVHTALLVGSLDFIAGPNRIITGWGLGHYDHEFDTAGMRGWNRREVLPEQVEIFRKLWTGEAITHRGRYYEFDDVRLSPTPVTGSVPIWYCGTSLAAARRAAEYCDGWIPGQLPRRDLRKGLARMRRIAEEAGRPVPRIGVIPWVVPGRTEKEAAGRLDVAQLLRVASERYSPPPSGVFATLDDFDGGVIAGPADKIVEEVDLYVAEGVEHIVFDMRARFSEWEECVAYVGEEVLPKLTRSPASARHPAGSASGRLTHDERQ
jgi:probable F420-dependent oxidoreductase